MNFRTLLVWVLSACAVFQLASCEKKESAIVLPPPGDAQPGRVTMGETYDNQVFYDFENNSAVMTSLNDSWDLSFETGDKGYHIWMNGGKSLLIMNTHMTDFEKTQSVPSAGIWKFDDPGGMPDSTAVGTWINAAGASNNEVYLVKCSDTVIYKMLLQSVDADKYIVKLARLNATAADVLTIPKNDNYNFTYYSFSNGIVKPEPPKADWDVVFARYRYIYRELDNFPYVLNGVLLNPNNTSAAIDSVHAFGDIDAELALSEMKSTRRDVIGFSWKQYNFSTSRYEIARNKTYILQTRNGRLIKFRFLDFYSPTGVKGSPSFESVIMR